MLLQTKYSGLPKKKKKCFFPELIYTSINKMQRNNIPSWRTIKTALKHYRSQGVKMTTNWIYLYLIQENLSTSEWVQNQAFKKNSLLPLTPHFRCTKLCILWHFVNVFCQKAPKSSMHHQQVLSKCSMPKNNIFISGHWSPENTI